ncbi:MAG: dinitrogenase iron-molybdenum cofactor biosynthesis protein [Actinobacteria bacterium]|nr:MAG: dinitrogenase iron-molybdenum cofactor biosynthesis protein [Actinomycetota bacterium]
MTSDDKMLLAVPSEGPGGLEAQRSGHFGKCDCFTLVELEKSKLRGVRVLQNPPHVDGGCMRPVELLAAHGVTALIVSGIGGRPLEGFKNAGIEVYFEEHLPLVRQVVRAMQAGDVRTMQPGWVCGGH